jgi:pyruvate dehydrogenase kinase 2/3/4
MLATVQKYHDAATLPPIHATIVAGNNDVGIRISDQGVYEIVLCVVFVVNPTTGGGLLIPQIKSPSDLFSFSHVRNATRMEHSRLGALRTVSSDPRGVKATVEEQVEPQSESPEKGVGMAASPRIGIGLPMSNIFATYVSFCYRAVTFRAH